jgi:hypothetical protein
MWWGARIRWITLLIIVALAVLWGAIWFLDYLNRFIGAI